MTFYKHTFTVLTLGASILSLGACGFSHPNAMPSGYTYHHDTYKSPVADASSKITVEQRQYMDATQAQQFRDAVYDLLERLTMRAGMPPKPVYVLAPDNMTAFYSNIDNDLREGMRHIGYAISDTQEDAYVFTYDAVPLAVQGESSIANNVQITLRVFSDLGEAAKQLTEETGQYFIQGAEALNIQPSRYNTSLPQQKFDVQEAVASVEAPTPVVEAPAPLPEAIAVEPIMSKPVVSPVPTVVSKSVAVPEKVIPRPPVIKTPEKALAIEPLSKPSAALTPREPITVPVVKAPSRDDIIIINRGDKAPIEVKIPDAPEDVMQKNSLQKAIPTTQSAIRSRVSNPADY